MHVLTRALPRFEVPSRNAHPHILKLHTRARRAGHGDLLGVVGGVECTSPRASVRVPPSIVAGTIPSETVRLITVAAVVIGASWSGSGPQRRCLPRHSGRLEQGRGLGSGVNGVN